MREVAGIPHRPAVGLCPVNGVRDLIQWRTGCDWSNEFVHGLAQGGGFAYLRVDRADPPRQVFWGNSPSRQHEYLAKLLGAELSVVEGRAWKTAWTRAREALDAGKPPVLGPMDMYYLHFYEGIYHRRHIPIHYELLVGHDDERATVLDTGCNDAQPIELEELQAAWDVNVPGMGKRNRLAVLAIPEAAPPVIDLVRQSVRDQSATMLRAPVSLLGIAAMKKLAAEIARWPDHVGAERAAACLRQVREYLSSPPDLEGSHLTAGRHIYIKFLEEAAGMTELDFSEGTARLRESMSIIPGIAVALRDGRLEEAGWLFGEVARVETEAWSALSLAVTEMP